MFSSRTHILLTGMLAVAAVAALLIAVLIGVTWWIALIVVVVVAAVVGIIVSRRAPDMAIRKLHAVPADVTGPHERLAHLVEGLCLSNGLREPALAVVDSPAVNGLVVGRSADDATLIATSGMIDSLDRTQLEGVVAHLLARVRSPELADATLAAVVIGSWLAPFPGLQRRALAWVLDAHPGVRADREAVSMTRYPPGLIAAFAAIVDASEPLGSRGRATRHLWLDDPVRTPDDAVDIPLAERMEALQEL